jgi:hypothetical protein
MTSNKNQGGFGKPHSATCTNFVLMVDYYFRTYFKKVKHLKKKNSNYFLLLNSQTKTLEYPIS